MADLDTLRELAGKATPGPWSVFETRQSRIANQTYVGPYPRGVAHIVTWGGPEPRDSNAAYIAACDPQTILALLDENERLRAALTNLRKTAALLQQNSVACAEQHHGADIGWLGLPGWLADTQKDIDAALTALSAHP